MCIRIRDTGIFLTMDPGSSMENIWVRDTGIRNTGIKSSIVKKNQNTLNSTEAEAKQ